ncbi:MAG: hypothetical protein KAG37_03020, partial [Flavobacteriales bacterium]|nr:hypothetical protein [Flavobacteriales bacterium]
NYPSLGYDQSSSDGAKCIFLGFDIKEKSKNPYAPSSVKLKFAISDSRKYITLACSGDTAKEIERIQGRSFRLSTEQKEMTVDNWDIATKGFTGSRRNRYIINGNILQGSADFAGKLVSYTTKGKGIKKGILMAESWLPTEENGVGNYVVAPIGKLEKQILSLRSGATMSTENKMTFAKYRHEDKFMIIMPKAKTHQSIYTDKDVIKLLENSRDGFEMISGNMKAIISAEKMPKLLKLLGERFSVSMKVPKHYFDEHLNSKSKNTSSSDALTDDAIKMLEDDTILFEKRLKKQKEKSSKLKVERSKQTDTGDDDMLMMLELEAEAIIIMQIQSNQYKQVAGFTNQRRMF